MKTTVIFHSADFDGLFCREIARKFLPDAELIGWNFGDEKITPPDDGSKIYVLDLSPDCLQNLNGWNERIIWIDHHKSSMEKWPSSLSGYRIDGVAASRLAWQYFTHPDSPFNAEV
jgi:oligoribonuclease NrnB/cAMP/cGMP phosphodiesterase (DHH superfamily)